MKSIIKQCLGAVLISISLTNIAMTQDQQANAGSEAFKSQKDKVSYGMGVNIARSFKQQNVDIDPSIIAKGMQDVFSGQKLQMSDDEINKTLNQFQEEMKAKQMEAAKAAAVENKKAGEAFLAANKTKPGVVTLPSGLLD